MEMVRCGEREREREMKAKDESFSAGFQPDFRQDASGKLQCSNFELQSAEDEEASNRKQQVG